MRRDGARCIHVQRVMADVAGRLGDGYPLRVRVASLERQVISDRDYSLDNLFPTCLTITRTSEEDWKTRQLVVAIDGKRVAELLWGDSAMFELAPGVHRLRVHNTLVWKTEEFTIAPGEQIFYEAINRASASTYFFLGMFIGIAPVWLTLRRMT
jgi:hypothetical protein